MENELKRLLQESGYRVPDEEGNPLDVWIAVGAVVFVVVGLALLRVLS